jgi:X-X-X-Leu-X-X-Gly heptad repeat protein
MATKKKVVKVRDLKPSKDAKGGAGSRQLSGGSRQLSGGSRQLSGGSRQLDGTTRQGG